MGAFVTLGCELFGRLSPYSSWHIEAHQFRIESQDNSLGKPTPEGIHQDGVNYVIMAMVRRSNMVNGSTQIYNREKIKIADSHCKSLLTWRSLMTNARTIASRP